jgi:tetratricopeptide (TPR) repeat protein
MSDNPRIDELRRRVEKDPTSIAFAQLAEEYRRTGDSVEAVKVCREGLARHPGYVSAQVTLGRALMELDQFDEACTELEAVMQAAPDNLAAIRALAEIHQRRGDAPESIHFDVAPLEAPSPVDVSLNATMPTFAETTASGQDAPAMTMTSEDLPSLEALDALSLDLPPMPDFSDWVLDTEFRLDTDGVFGGDQGSGIWDQKLSAQGEASAVLDPRSPIADPAKNPALEALEEWLAAIVADRSQSQ